MNEADAFALPGEEVTEDETDKEFTIKPEEKKQKVKSLPDLQKSEI